MRASVTRAFLIALCLGVTISSTACSAAMSEGSPMAQTVAPDGEWFVETGCTACHSVSVYGVWNPGLNAPDLSLAVEDVPVRFGRSLEDFLREPTGTMAMVLSSRIPLDERERAVAVEKLHEAYALSQRKKGGVSPVPSH